MLTTLCEFSHKYGSDPEFVLAGGGNTSCKDENHLYIKGSGTALATIAPEGFVKMDRKTLDAMLTKTYSSDEATREAEVLADLMAAKAPGEEAKRPSVETLLHNLFKQKFVLHVHPAKVNGITCSVHGDGLVKAYFPDAVWVESTRPGYTLAMCCKDKLDAHKAATGKDADVLFLQNHGIFFAADSEEALDKLVSGVMHIIGVIANKPDFSEVEYDADKVTAVAPVLRMVWGEGKPCVVKFTVNKAVMDFAKSKEAFAPLMESMTPDHIVYCKAHPLFIENGDVDTVKAALSEYVAKYGIKPRVVFVKELGMFAVAENAKTANTVTEVWLDAVKIVDIAEKNYGGVNPMTPELIDFIVNWEVESYRSKVAAGSGSSRRLEGKIAIVTGSAQGFGKGIAESMAAEGAYVVVADMNAEGAKATAEELCAAYGKGTAISVGANVSDEESVKAMVNACVKEYGGLDVFVNNAGIVRAGSLEEMTKANFELVAAVNYTAYFLCAKYASAVMKTQRSICPEYLTDIIEINSKSGLEPSNKNFAYAGSKFGGIGLTSSFALELAPYGIKVNAVCPGNFLNGPLWSDPEKGLFVQYLNAGKVPGAKTVEDVRRFYEAKVPLNRGCEIKDVARAIMYIIEQEYETGQAIPVTGGQVMLH